MYLGISGAKVVNPETRVNRSKNDEPNFSRYDKFPLHEKIQIQNRQCFPGVTSGKSTRNERRVNRNRNMVAAIENERYSEGKRVQTPFQTSKQPYCKISVRMKNEKKNTKFQSLSQLFGLGIVPQAKFVLIRTRDKTH